jgi:hypothetical protein
MIGKLLVGAAVIIGAWYLVFLPGWCVLRSSPEVSVITEIDQLHNALQAHKEKHLVYPPSMAIANEKTRKSKFMTHLRSVYPGSTYGVRVADFDRLNQAVGATYRVPAGNAIVALDLNRLDQAEALAFWLGGLPTPVAPDGRPTVPDRLFGFNIDAAEPLKRSLDLEAKNPLATRTTSRFDFRQERLVDNDEDGWWEYVPTPPHAGAAVAPFVYFDYDAYGSAAKLDEILGYPRPGDLQADRLRQTFGFAVPMAARFEPPDQATLRWQNPQSFQILCGGLDGRYSAPTTGMRVSIFPSGDTYPEPNFNGAPDKFDDQELDNLTNLQRQNLGDARADARGGVAQQPLGLGEFEGPIVAVIAVLIVAYLFVRMQYNSRPIGGRLKQAGDRPEFSDLARREP